MKNYIREARLKHRLTQAELARAIGISRPQLSQIERGVYNPSLRLALKISKVLKIPLNDLFKLNPSDWDK